VSHYACHKIITVYLKKDCTELEPPRHVKAMSNVGVGPPFPLIEKKIKVLFFSFIEEIKFNTWELFNLPR
jgi:hypothetical protein